MALLDEALAFVVSNTTGFKAYTSTGDKVPIFLNHMPPEVPDVAVGFYEPGGAPPLAGLAATVPVVERPRIQVLSRAETYEVARDNAQTIWDTFFALTNSDLSKNDGSTGVTFWASAEPNHSPARIGEDAERRQLVSADFQITKEMS